MSGFDVRPVIPRQHISRPRFHSKGWVGRFGKTEMDEHRGLALP
jgi:hypothetical protein